MKKTMALLTSLLMLSVPVLATSVHVQYGMDSGTVSTYVDETSGNSHSEFHGTGDVNGDLWSDDQSYGMLQTDVLASGAGGTDLQFIATQIFPNGGSTYGEIYAGGSDTAYMNARMQSSGYVFEMERHLSNSNPIVSASGASGYGLYHELQTNTSGGMNAQSTIQLGGSGSGSFDMNQWHASGVSSYGWGGPNNVNTPSPPGYYTPTLTVSATGSGQYMQTGLGLNSLTYNGFSMPGGGSASTFANFGGGFSGTPQVNAN